MYRGLGSLESLRIYRYLSRSLSTNKEEELLHRSGVWGIGVVLIVEGRRSSHIVVAVGDRGDGRDVR
jgi:hypothetical protein